MKNPSIRSILILVIFSLIAYSLVDGIRYGNILGIVLAIGSLGAFGFSILLINRLKRLKEQEEEEMEAHP
jgi:membrane-bound ClpP family serine protease